MTLLHFYVFAFFCLTAKATKPYFKLLKSKSLLVGSLTESEGARFLELIRGAKDRRAPSINATLLREILGKWYEADLMSETQPNGAWLKKRNKLEKGAQFASFKENKEASEDLWKFFQNKGIYLNTSQFEDVRYFLWNITRCKAEPFWQDLGRNVWPRFVNFGKCSFTNNIKQCKVRGKKKIRLLYWVCPKSLSKKKCYWAFFETKVIRSCGCSC
ncbi:noggin-3-like [Xenia sp. Carnegie-2017]|uniref:noggin-3-like n=1 Tax=Xenia sp. Carnegie-2017 TaxID=2897299 RepID=UPI001F0488A3|nr:noggin-3-like [Xenia sp. Carnegie-2017]